MTTATKLIKAVSQPAVDKKRDGKIPQPIYISDFEMNFNLSRTGMPALMEEYLSGGDYHLVRENNL